jgi:hypothetical protein
MPDHINIHPPRRRDELEDRLKFERVQVELTVLREAYDELRGDMDSIFTRIGRREQVELHYPDGEIVLITRAKPRTEKEG